MIPANPLPGGLFGFTTCCNVQYFESRNQLGIKSCGIGTYGAHPVVKHLDCKADSSDLKSGELSNPFRANLEVKIKPENSRRVNGNEISDC
jgi:hypothetical protein